MRVPRPNPIICAIDTADPAAAERLAGQLSSHVGAIKLGLEFFTANGPVGVKKLGGHKLPIFLDLKLHDIPNTVAGAVRSMAGLNVFMTTIHASGGAAMMRAAAEAAKTLPKKPILAGVTVLTSMDETDMEGVGVGGMPADQVKRLAALAQESGLDGIVCSPLEIEMLRRQCGKDFMLIVPGIRPAGSGKDDQKRIMTPREAMEQGADWLVIGRPITGAADPAEAARGIAESL